MTYRIAACSIQIRTLFQSPQKSKGDCDFLSSVSLSRNRHKFQSPQKPKGDCDLNTFPAAISIFFSSNHPKSRKAIVTFNAETIFACKLQECSNHPKSRKAIVTASIFQKPPIWGIMFQSPQKPKGDCDNIFCSIFRLHDFEFQSPQKPKGDCDGFVPSSDLYSFQRTFQSPQKPKGDCDTGSVLQRLVIPTGSNHPKSRKAIVTYLTLLKS